MARLLLAALLAGLAPAACAWAQSPAAARPLLEELQQARLDETQSYKVIDLHLRRDAIRIRLHLGNLVFLQPTAGRVTGAVFDGTGEVLVMPPDRVERQQLAKFTGSPILTESFTSAYFRFSDNTFADWHRQIRAGAGKPQPAPGLLEAWEPQLASLNRLHSVRILLDLLEPEPATYFYAAVRGQRLGSFDIVVDDRRTEQILVGQSRSVDDVFYYDVWSSFARRDRPPLPAVHTSTYRINATITPARKLQALCQVELELSDPKQRVLLFQLSRFLHVEEVAEVRGETTAAASEDAVEPLEFFQNVTFSEEEAQYRGSDMVVVVLPRALRHRSGKASGKTRGAQRRTLRFRYHGGVISDVGGGVLYVGARGNWYPRADASSLAHYELRFRWPRALELVAPGTLRARREDGEWKESLWVSDVPLPLAGFNLGDYERRELRRGPVPVIVYANRSLEPQLAEAAQPHPVPPPSTEADSEQAAAEKPPASPSLMLEEVANELAEAGAHFSELFGPFPYPQLKVSQIPGRFGQGYPGLLYLSTLSFLDKTDQVRMGLDARVQEHFSQLIPAHETAHQWWGNKVRFPHYREQWLAEGLASYSALLHLEMQPNGQALVRRWLERYRNDLLETDGEGRTAESSGALTLGLRLNSSRSPNGYVRLVYSKGPWVLHMLRELLRDPETGSDALFLRHLRELAMRGEELTTERFQRQFEASLPAYADAEETGRLDWFFQQWIYDTGIPHYRLRWEARHSRRQGWQVQGTISQSEVSALFTMPVPVYARFGQTLTSLGRVVVTGEKVDFRFPVRQRPDEVVLDPYGTVLCLVD